MRIIIRKKKNEYRLYCDTIDEFTSDILDKNNMFKFMENLREFKNNEKLILQKFWACLDRSTKYYSYAKCLKSHNKNSKVVTNE